MVGATTPIREGGRRDDRRLRERNTPVSDVSYAGRHGLPADAMSKPLIRSRPILSHFYRPPTVLSRKDRYPLLQSWFGGSGDLYPTQNEGVTNP